MVTFDPSLDSSSSKGLGQRRLVILDHILSCEPAKPIVAELLCCRNAMGLVPFQHALHKQNYAAALKLLQFVTEYQTSTSKISEEFARKKNSSLPYIFNLFELAIMAPGTHGLTPLQSIIGSFGKTMDVKAMKLFVARLPQNYTAQQLLRLFQRRYPSVYKATIFKEDEEEENGSSDEETDETRGGGANEGRSANSWQNIGQPQVVRERSRQQSLFNNSAGSTVLSLTGVVYFSNLAQLRAALMEMQNHRVVTNASRSAGFSAHMTGFLDVYVEEFGTEDGDNEHAGGLSNQDPLLGRLSSMRDFFPFVIPPSDNRGRTKSEKTRCQLDAKLRSPALAYELFTKLLAYTHVSTAVSSDGDTALTTVVHNPACTSALMNVAKQKEEPTETQGGLPPSLESLSGIIEARNGHRPSPSATQREKLSETVKRMSSLCGNPNFTLLLGSHSGMDNLLGKMSAAKPNTSSSGEMISGDDSSTVTTSSPQELATTSDFSRPSSLTPHATTTATSRDSSTHTLASLPSSSHGDDDSASKPAESQTPAIARKGLSNYLTLAQYTLEDMPENQSLPPRDTSADLSSARQSNLPSSDEAGEVMGGVSGEGETPGSFVVEATDEQAKSQFSLKLDEKITMETTPCNPAESDSETAPKGMGMGQGGSTKNTEVSSSVYDFLGPLFSNWPCIVTTVLGFYPLGPSADWSSILKQDDQSSSQSCNRPSLNEVMSSVQALDSFTMHLILNCNDACIENFTSTIVRKINLCLAESSSINLDTSVHDVDLTTIDEKNLPIIVGKRFLNSVIRVFGMEHSRVKNTFLEMQQLRSASREGGEGGRERGRGGMRRGIDRDTSAPPPLKNVVKIAKSILTKFSALAVLSIAESAAIASAPVRLGIAKPMGASSVSAEYSAGSHRATASAPYRGSVRQPKDPFRCHQRQLHVRSAYHLPNPTSHSTHTHPPSEGIVLRPVTRSSAPHSDGMASIDSVCAEGEVGSLHGTSSEGEGSEHDEETGVLDLPSPSLHLLSSRLHPQWNNMWSSSSSSSSEEEEEEYWGNGVLFAMDDHDLRPQDNNRRREQLASITNNVYPFAWALDGRRIGEAMNMAGSASRSMSPTSYLASQFGGHHEQSMPLFTIPSVRFGAGFLARTFSRFVKDLVDITTAICDNKSDETRLILPPQLLTQLLSRSLSQLESTWQWLVRVMDVAEGQIQRGQGFDVQRHVLSLRSDGPHPTSSSNAGHDSYRSFIGSTPAEYMTYLLRAHAKEDTNTLPVIDLYGYEHVVFVLDALIYTLTHWPKSVSVQTDQSNPTNPMTSSPGQSEELQIKPTPPVPMETSSSPTHDKRFFTRSESILASSGTSESEGDSEMKKSNWKFFCSAQTLLKSPDLMGGTNFVGGGPGSRNSFSQPLSEAFPLAQQPHLLKPFAKKEHLFSSPGRVQGGCEGGDGGGEGEGGEERKRGKAGTSLPVSYGADSGASPVIPSPVPLTLTVDQALLRWHSCISVFAHVFLAEGPGGERDNFLNARAGFASRMARFRQQVSQLYEASISHREWSSTVSNSLSLRIRRNHLLQDAMDQLWQLTKFHYTQVRVKFEGEEGSGPGVNRGFFSTLANELKSSDTSKPVLNQVGILFSEPGKHPEQSGHFSPSPFFPSSVTSLTKTIKAKRRMHFRATGRYLGLCFWFRYTIPLMVCRHVAKYLLGRELAWHDLAFYNADLYEGLRRMLLDVQEGKKSTEEFMSTYCCYFEVPLSGSMEPILFDLIPGGSKIPVTPNRVQEYVRLYAMFVMYGCVRDELEAMKEGLNDVIPPELLAGLTAEDFQLLLSGGSANITLSRLKSVIRFNHTHGNTHAICDRFEKMFWRVVSHMTNSQRQELLYFATGSGALPSETDTNAQTPALLITINVIGTGNTNSLPVASTCSQRMSIPLYPSYLVLKKKLLQAIQCQAYGLG